VMLHRARMRMWKCLDKNWFGNADDGASRRKKKRGNE
jgi:hypothetical protein